MNGILIPAPLFSFQCSLLSLPRPLFSFPRRREPRGVHAAGSLCLCYWIPVFTGMTKKEYSFSFPRRREPRKSGALVGLAITLLGTCLEPYVLHHCLHFYLIIFMYCCIQVQLKKTKNEKVYFNSALFPEFGNKLWAWAWAWGWEHVDWDRSKSVHIL